MIVPTALAITVAVAAPVIPIAGIDPQPKINIGSNIMLITADTIIIMAENTGFPSALIIFPIAIGKMASTEKITRIDI
jgi:hypothetical protein